MGLWVLLNMSRKLRTHGVRTLDAQSLASLYEQRLLKICLTIFRVMGIQGVIRICRPAACEVSTCARTGVSNTRPAHSSYFKYRMRPTTLLNNILDCSLLFLQFYLFR